MWRYPALAVGQYELPLAVWRMVILWQGSWKADWWRPDRAPLDDLGRQYLKAQGSLHQGAAPCRETRPATARSPTLAPRSNQRQRSSWRRAWLMQWAPKSRPSSHCGDAEGIAGPIPGALGNRDLVVLVGVALSTLLASRSVGPDHPCTRSRGSAAYGSRLSGLGRPQIAGLTGAS
jgi:hypothetical protein